VRTISADNTHTRQTTHNMQHATHTTHNTQHTTHNTQHTTYNTQHTTHNTQHTKHTHARLPTTGWYNKRKERDALLFAVVLTS
jgi:hypothetical protein